MIRLFFIFFLACLSNIAATQTWPIVYPGRYIRCLIESYDKGYLMAGPKGSYLMSWIVKTDINGNTIWEKMIGNGKYQCILGSVDQTPDGGMVAAGLINKYDSEEDPFIIKLNACGEIEWCSIISTPTIYDYAIIIKCTSDSNFVMLTLYSDPNPANRIQLFKFDQAGGLIWRQNYPPDSLMFAEDSKNLFIDSSFYLISANCYYPDSGQPGGYERPYYIKTDTAGNIIWRLIYGKENGFHGFPFYQPLKSQSGYFYDIGWHSNQCDTPALIKFSATGEESYFQDLFPGACPGRNGA